MLISIAFLAAICFGAIEAKGFSCAEGDGFYAIGCSTSYIQCVNSIPHIFKCPETLYFDTILSRCEGRASANVCKDPESVKGQFIKSGVADCANKDDGIYAIGRCSDKFLACSNGHSHVRKCPYNQVYVARSQRCDLPENNPHCFKSKQASGSIDVQQYQVESGQPLTAPNNIPSVVPASDVENGFNCTGLGEATISTKKCSPEFWKCSNGKLFKHTCPSGLLYDSKNDLCDYPEVFQECSETKTNVSHEQIVSNAIVEVNCTEKEDGFYSLSQCGPIFVSCHGGVQRKIDCVKGLVYDSRITACDYPLACRSERKQEAVPNLFNHGNIAETPKEQELVDFDCTGKTDGQYAIKFCHQAFAQCVSGQPSVRYCPSGLVFNHATEVCDYKENCTSAIGSDASTTVPYSSSVLPPVRTTVSYEPTTTPSPSTTTTTQTTTTTTAPVTQALSEDLFSCANLANGAYAAAPCDQRFYTCWGGARAAHSCSQNLVFNPYQSSCDYKHNVPECNPKPATGEDAAVEAPLDPYCERLADGQYGFGCNTFYYQCSSFETHKQKCPAGLFYNTKGARCDQPENIIECRRLNIGGPYSAESITAIPSTHQTTTSVPRQSDATTSPSINPYGEPTPIPATPEKPSQDNHIFDCTGQPDGIFALPYCTKDYVQCVGGRSYVASCASGLYYSESSGLCDYKVNVPNCAPSLQPPPPPAQDIPAHSCQNKVNGFYSFGCASTYYSCFDKKVIQHKCPSNLKFSRKLQICEYDLSVEECTPVAQSVPVTRPPPIDQSVCNGRENGFYGHGKCSDSFIVCSNGQATLGKCASPLVYNQQTGLCDYASNTHQCSSY